MLLTKEQIEKYSHNHLAAPVVAKWFNEFAPKYAVDTPQRVAAFLAQVIHESDRFRTAQEYASGRAYEGRLDLGNTHIGDGIRFKGRGYIQVTGRNNYRSMGKLLFNDESKLIQHPELLEVPEHAMRSALIYWNGKQLNKYADLPVDHKISTKKHGIVKPFGFITLLINGGFNHFTERIIIYNTICTDLKLPIYK